MKGRHIGESCMCYAICVLDTYRTLTIQYEKEKPILKWAKELNRQFFKEEIQMDTKHVKRLLNIISHQKNVRQDHTMKTESTLAVP